MTSPVWTDNHCHLERDTFKDQLAEAQNAGVNRLIAIGTDAESSREAMEIANSCDEIWATAGIHPHETKDYDEPDSLLGLESLLDDDRVVAVGECGLDFYYDHSDREVQKRLFQRQIKLAVKHNMALVIHTRDAWQETFEILDSEETPKSTIFHCFTGGPKEAEAILERGGYISFSGILTFKNAPDIREAAKLCPLDSILLETDAPFLSPEPKRGQTNTPANLVLVGEKLSQVKEIDLNTLAGHIWDNTSRAYSI